MFASAAVYLLSALIVVPISKKLGLGSVMGYLIAGILIGPSTFSLVGDQSEVMHFAEFGVVMMLFLVGLELQPRVLWKLRSSIFGLGFLQVGLTVIIISGLLFLLTEMLWQTCLTLGLMFALSSTAIVLQTLQEKGWIKEPAGEKAFSVLLFQDIAVIPMLAMLPLLALSDLTNEQSDHNSLLSHLPMLWQVGGSIIAISLIVFASRYLINPIFKIIAKMHIRELFTVFALFIVISISLLMSAIGLSPALGTFLAGVVLAESDFRHELEGDIEPFKGLLLGLFFITVGASIDLALLSENAGLIICLVMSMILIKALILGVLASLFELKGKQLALFTLSLAQGGEFAFVLISMGASLAILNTFEQSVATLVVALSMLLAPVILMAFEKWISRCPDKVEVPDSDVEPTGNVIVIGYGRFGQVIGRILESQGYSLSILDHSISQIELLKPFGRKVFYGDGERLDLLEAAGAANASLIVISLDDPDKSMNIIELCKKHFPSLPIVARAVDRRHAYRLLRQDISSIRRETLDSSVRLGVEALKLLGVETFKAEHVGEFFISFDEQKLRELSNLWGTEKYSDAVKASVKEFEELSRV